jgi:hypothetical protein
MTDETTEFQSVMLSPQEVLRLWPTIEQDVAKALVHGIDELTPFDICRQALDGKIQVWLTVDTDKNIVCTTTTRFLSYPGTKALQIITCTGTGRRWEEFFHQHRAVEDFAKAQGCTSIQVWGRKGWSRRLNRLSSRAGNSYETLYYVFNMEI